MSSNMNPEELQEFITEYRLDDGEDFFYDKQDDMDLWHSKTDLLSDSELCVWRKKIRTSKAERLYKTFPNRWDNYLEDKQWNKK